MRPIASGHGNGIRGTSRTENQGKKTKKIYINTPWNTPLGRRGREGQSNQEREVKK